MSVILTIFHISAGAEEACRFEAGSAFVYGWVQGSLQTPNGGQVISTDNDRPTLAELDIDDASMVDFWVNAQRPDDGLYFGGRLIHLQGDSVLKTDLLSQEKLFPAGSAVKADVTFDWYRFGYSHRHLYQWGTRTVEFSPSIGAILLTFDYGLTSPGLEAVDRSYSKSGVQFGLHVCSALTEKLTLSGRLLLPIALSNSVNITCAQVMAQYQLLKREDLEISGSFGIGYERIEYQDNQLMPNDIKLELSPMLLAGLEIVF